MILLIFAIVFSTLVLSVEIPVYICNHDEIDFLIIVMFSIMLVAGWTVLFFWRGV